MTLGTAQTTRQLGSLSISALLSWHVRVSPHICHLIATASLLTVKLEKQRKVMSTMASQEFLNTFPCALSRIGSVVLDKGPCKNMSWFIYFLFYLFYLCVRVFCPNARKHTERLPGALRSQKGALEFRAAISMLRTEPGSPARMVNALKY